MTPISDLDILIRLAVITVLAGAVGIEREYHAKPAGLRTNVMVGLGSTIMTISGLKAVELFPHLLSIDPTRIAAQVITGIGFIGAGAILRPGKSNVIGLTTAATLWVVSGLGIAVGMGLYYEAIVTTLLVFFTFMVLSQLVGYVRQHAKHYSPDMYHHPDEDVTHVNQPHVDSSEQ
ncbi:MAG: MgtC/SapB family protein [Patescibacteria group bacterium]|nr:MgtC/SapB family protein [Patescibacteria group bacterium]